MKVKCKLKDNVIIGYFCQYSEKPLHKVGCNFDESKDFENAVTIDIKYLDKIVIGQSKVINHNFIEK